VDSDTLRFTAVANAVGIEWFTLRVTDNYGLYAQINIQFNVTGILNIAITSGNNNTIHYNNETFDIGISLTRNANGSPFATGS
jgi:hypothetical protein